MRGKHYDEGKRRVFSNGGYIGLIIVIIVLAALVATTLLVLLPSTEEIKTDAPKIVSIQYPDSEIGAGSILDKIYLTVTYSDGKTESVALSSMIHEGLDITSDTQQEIFVSYGGFEDTIIVNVKKVDCVLTYSASDGGHIQGDTEQSIVSGGDADTVIAVPETGYTFVGWSDGYPYAERKDLGVNETRSYIANFEKTKFNVVFFFFDGTTTQEEEVTYGEKAINIPDENDPKMRVYGYTFVGWSVSEEDYSCVTRDMNIYPRYEKTATDVSVEVSTDRAGNVMGSTDINDYGYYEHSDTERAVIVATPDNSREFNNWAVLNSDGVYVDLGKDSVEEKEVEIGDKRTKVSFRVSAASSPGTYSISFLCNADMEYVSLKAEFAYASSSVTFLNYQNKNSGNIECTVDDVINGQTIGDKISLSGVNRPDGKPAVIDDEEGSQNRGLPLPYDVAGMTFVGWYMQSDPEQKIIDATQTFIEPSTLIAKWEKKIYNLIFEYEDENNNKQIYSDNMYVYYQNTVGSGGGLPAGIPYRDRYVFNGWLDKYTHTTVDDTTQIIMHDEYGEGQDTDFAKGIICFIASWTPVEHELTVNVEGEGSVALSVTDLETQAVSSQDVLGRISIYENKNYNIEFTANSGYEIESVIWTYGDSTETYGDDTAQATGFGIFVKERMDNTITVVFKPISYKVTVINGDSVSGGYIIAEDGTTFDANEVSLYFNAAAPVRFSIQSKNEIYAIEQILVSGKADGQIYDNELKYNFAGGTDVTEYGVSLDNIASDLTITIKYKGRIYSVSVNQQPFSDAENDYPIMQTTLNGRESDYTVPESQKDYAYGERIFFALRADEGNYISAVMFDGIIQDLYAGSGYAYFYDWEINGQSLGISLLNVDGRYYYNYGKAGKDIYGTDYVYCESVEGGTVTVFAAGDIDGEYTEVDTGSSDGIALKEYLEEVLGVDSKRISDYTVPKDARVTAVKLMLIVNENVNLSMVTNPLYYNFTVEESDYTSVEYSAEIVDMGQSVTVSVSPITGYKITGYAINGVVTEVSSLTQGENFVFTVSDIREDKFVEIIFEAVKYNFVFVNSTPLKGNVFVEEITSGTTGNKNILASTYTYALEYASGGRFRITVEEGKRITSVKIDGKLQNIVFNADSFVYSNYNVTKAIRIEIECADKEINSSEDSSYTVKFNIGENVTPSVEYGISGNNVITLVAEEGYNITKVTVTGMKDGTSKVINIDSTTATFNDVVFDAKKVVITLGSDEFDGEATVTATYSPDRFTLTAQGTSGGTVIGGGTIYYGNESSISVSADANYYISSFKVNGEEISFVSSNWISKTASAYAGKYTAGEYKFITGGDMNIEVGFSLFTYKVTLDTSSINGTTEFFVDSADGQGGSVDRIAHGSNLGINMKADAGYHISAIYINGEKTDYRPYTNVENDNTDDSYTYINVTGNISVYVEYTINRYEFRYSLINGSANFGNETDTGNRLECIDATLISENLYGNIAHGDNFSITVTPGVSKGYYIYSIRIVYSRYNGGERIRYAGDGFSETGGTIWFNRFLWDNNAAGSVGVTANIELIEIVFMKKTYNVEITQTGDKDGGSVAFSVTNSLNPAGGVYMFDGPAADSVKYMYLGGKIYREQEYGFAETDIALKYIDGEWKFYSETEASVYDMYFEYGLRYTVTLIPTEGYERNAFTVNGEDKSGSVYNDRYSFNVYRATEITVMYRILTFEINVNAVAYQANMSEVPERNVYKYASIKLIGINEDGVEEELAAIVEGKASFTAILDYGTVIKLEITPNFAEYGAYLFNLQSGNIQLTIPGDATGTVVYGGSGIKVVENLSYRATFRIMEYQVRVDTQYDEQIKGETKNVFGNDSTGVVAWKSSWNSSTVIKAVAGTGYYIDRIIIQYNEGGTTKEISIDDYYLLEDIYGGVELGYEIRKGNEDPIYGLRDTITIYGIKSDYNVTAYFAREEYEIIYIVNDLDYIEGVKTIFNERNGVYPNYQYDTRTGTGWTLPSHYYDELSVTITPKDGYKISVEELTVECLEYSETAGEYVIKTDENGKPMTYKVSLVSTGNGDEKLFTFHQLNLPSADHYIESTIRISINLSIKEYRVNTTITRTRASGDTSVAGNNTSVRLGIRDKNNDQIIVGGALQSDGMFVPGTIPAVMTAQHHGFMLYTFTTPEGYMMTKFTVNGFTLEELTESGIAEEYTQIKRMSGTVVTYDYTIKLRITSELIKGSSTPWLKVNDITVDMEIAPITYEVKVVINGEIMEYQNVGGRNGVTDGEQLSVYTMPTVTHFGVSSIEPSLFEGYRIKDTTTGVYFGTESGYEVIESNRAGFMKTGTVINGFYMLRFVGENLVNSDVSAGKTVVYFIFNTQIISYTEEIATSVYYSHNNGTDYELITVPLNGNTAAGSVKVTVMTRDGREYEIDLENEELFSESLEYFTTIRIDAEAKPGFTLYGIYEEFIVDGKSEYRRITSGQRNISYSTTGGRHTVLISVKDLTGEVLGNRKFRLDFKQQAEITLTIANPYKYIEATRRYSSYVDVKAYSAENELGLGTPSASYAISNTNIVAGEIVVETYRFTVYVGNYIKFIISDKYVSGTPVVRYYEENMKESAGDVFAELGITAIGETGRGERIIKESVNYYAYVNVSGRISTTKKTIGAITSTNGGSVSYNSLSAGTGTTNVINDANTVPGKTLTIRILPAENYAFYQLKIRQPIMSTSRKQGYIVFETAEALAWNAFTFNEVGNTENLEIFAGSNYLRLLSTRKDSVTNEYVFEFWVCGDAEFEVEFYRTYDISYGIYMTDKVSQGGENLGITGEGITFTPGSVSDILFGADAIGEGSTKGKVSYGATFELTAQKPKGDYQFVGWYVNGYNLYGYLESLLPTDDYLTQNVTVTIEEMQSLVQDGEEAKELTVYAIFQPIIDVMVFNEKYYAYEDHFNSWDLGTILATYYEFVRGKPITAEETTTMVRDSKGQILEDARKNLETSNTYKSFGGAWSTLLSGTDATASYTGELAESKVYSSFGEFTLLYQNITNGDFYTDSWEDTAINLNITNMSATAAFGSWQYFNWNTQTWENILYTYIDTSYGMSSSGQYTTVDCYFNSYSLNLSALYTFSGGNVLMPYAISATNANNIVETTEDIDGIRPLLIRSDLYQTVKVNLSQNMYSTDLGNEDPEQTLMPDSYVIPKIMTGGSYIVETTPGAGRASTSDTGREGTYEYGTKITIANNGNNPGGEIIVGNIRYRFLGWFMKYNKTLYYMESSEYDSSGKTMYSVMLTCLSDRPETEFMFIAIYVAQYKQSIYSYNISGGSMETYASASTSMNSVDAAPVVTFSAPSSEVLTFASFTQNSTGKITYEAGISEKNYWINAVGSKLRLTTQGEDYSAGGREFEYYVDAGLVYTIELPDPGTTENTVKLSDIKSSHITGYCPDTDTPYMFVKNQNEKEPLADFKSFYNTGYATYYDGENAVTASYIHQLADEQVGTISTTKEDAKRSNQYDLRYASTATLIFYNLMYQGGVSVPAKLASDLSGDKTSELTIWDESTKYGDYNTISNGKPVALGANGEVVIRVTLVCVTDAGYQGEYKFAFAGMDNGKGFPTNGTIAGPSGNGLFAPANDGKISGKLIFTRWYEIDLSKRTTTRLFGSDTGSGTINNNKIGEHASTPYVYTNANGGNAIDGYKIINVSQLKAIGSFWGANENSCVGIIRPSAFELFTEEGDRYPIWIDEASVEYTDNYKNNYGRTKFILTASQYNIVGLTIEGKTGDPMGNVVEWEPLCKGNTIMEDTKYVWGTNMMPERTGGFDGILEGNNALICGIATKASNHTYFGLFSAISGGEVRNLTIDNAYINTDDAQNVGLLAGLITYSTIENIKFEQKTSYAITSRGGFSANISKGTRVYLNAPQADNVGLLAGILDNSKVIDINIIVATGANYSIEINGAGNIGLLSGTVEGNESEISSVQVSGYSNSWVIIGTCAMRNTNSGGLVGEMKDASTMSNIIIDDNVNMIIGNHELTINAGGVVGYISGSKANLNAVTFNGYNGGGADDFTYSVDSQIIHGKGIYILANGTSGYGKGIGTSGSIGKAGGLVGLNAGTINNYYGEKYYTVKGVFKMHGGYIGGIAGVNTGRITGFDLKSGYNSSSYYSGIMVMAWFSPGTSSFGVGGIAGANISISAAKEVPKEINTNEYSLEKTLSGIVDDCSITGVADVKNSNDTYWQVGHIYAFIRNYPETSYYMLNTGETQNSLGYIYSHNIMMGGIVGYNKGSVFNSFVKQTKITFNVQGDASRKESKIEPLEDKYSWALESGLIAGYHDPEYDSSKGWTNINDILNIWDTALAKTTIVNTFSNDMISGRIQSCYSLNSVIAVVGRMFMDNNSSSDAMRGGAAHGNESLKCGISMGGICGGSSSKAATEFAINTCYASGNVMNYNVTPYGRSDRSGGSSDSTGWHTSKSGTGAFNFEYDNYWTYCRNPFYQVELVMCAVTGGINAATDANAGTYNKLSDGIGRYSKDYDYVNSLTTKCYYPNDGSTAEGAVVRYEVNHWDGIIFRNKADYPSGDTRRYTRYGSLNNDTINTQMRSRMPKTSGGELPAQNNAAGSVGGIEVIQETSSYGIDYGIMKGKIIKTDVYTGILVYTDLYGKLMRKGEAISGAYEKELVIYEFILNNEQWTAYNVSLAAPGGLETNPSTAIFCVRGQ